MSQEISGLKNQLMGEKMKRHQEEIDDPNIFSEKVNKAMALGGTANQENTNKFNLPIQEMSCASSFQSMQNPAIPGKITRNRVNSNMSRGSNQTSQSHLHNNLIEIKKQISTEEDLLNLSPTQASPFVNENVPDQR